MKRPVLREMLQNERHRNLLFNKGWRRTLVMILIYIAVRFSDPIVGTVLSRIPLALEFNLFFGLFVAICIGWVAMLGNVKLAGILCLVTPVANMMMMVSAAKLYPDGFAEMLRRAPTAWYVLASSVVCGVVGIALLLDRTAATFGRRRKEIQKEYAIALKTWANETKHHKVRSEHHRPESVKPPKEQVAVHEQEPAQCAPLQEKARIYKDATKPIEKKAAVGKTPEEATGKAEDNLHRQTITEHMTALEKEPLTLRASSVPNAISKVSKQRFFDLFREMVCKEFDCYEEEVDSATYILVFPENKLVLMKWLPEEKKICLESNTKRYGAQFHALVLDVISYLSKNMGVKFDIADIDKSQKIK